jgi:hypothetical protein
MTVTTKNYLVNKLQKCMGTKKPGSIEDRGRVADNSAS